jgi:hypothetical protein
MFSGERGDELDTGQPRPSGADEAQVATGVPYHPGTLHRETVTGFSSCSPYDVKVRITSKANSPCVASESNVVSGETCCGSTCETYRPPAHASGVNPTDGEDGTAPWPYPALNRIQAEQPALRGGPFQGSCPANSLT